MRDKSTLGLIETYGFVGAVEGLDVALKSADVELVSCEFVKGGIVTVLITGDVASVKAGVEAACTAIDRIGTLRNAHVIARAEEGVWNILQKKEKEISISQEEVNNKLTEAESLKEDEVIESDNNIEENLTKEVNELLQETKDEFLNINNTKDKDLNVSNTKDENKNAINVSEILLKTKEELELLKVPELRTIARHLKEQDKISLTKKQIKFSKKDQLIEAILKVEK